MSDAQYAARRLAALRRFTTLLDRSEQLALLESIETGIYSEDTFLHPFKWLALQRGITDAVERFVAEGRFAAAVGRETESMLTAWTVDVRRGSSPANCPALAMLHRVLSATLQSPVAA